MRSPNIRLIPATEVSGLCHQTDRWAEVARQFISSLSARGTLHYVNNIDVQVALLQLGEQLVPITVAPPPGQSTIGGCQANVVRPSVHYVDYHREAMARSYPRMPAWWFGARSLPMNAAARFGAMDRVVIVNQWLLTTCPAAHYRVGDPLLIVDALSDFFPDCAIIVRGLLPERQPDQAELFIRAGFRMIPYRPVWIIDDCAEALKRKRNARSDLRMLEQSDYVVRTDLDFLDSQAERLAELYFQLYMNKHSRHNIYFKPEFIRLALHSGLWQMVAFEKDGCVDAVEGWFVKNGLVTASITGYDLSMPKSLGLYRQAIIYQIRHAARLGLPLHISSGVGAFKAHRGAMPYREYEAIWDRHLPPRRRVPWALLDSLIHRTVHRSIPGPSSSPAE